MNIIDDGKAMSFKEVKPYEGQLIFLVREGEISGPAAFNEAYLNLEGQYKVNNIIATHWEPLTDI